MYDKSLSRSYALPDGAAAVATDPIDLGLTSRGDLLPQVELVITAPALTTAELGDGDTMTIGVYQDTAADFATEAMIATAIVQTGADGAGAAAASHTLALPADCGRFVRLKSTNSGSGDCSGKAATVAVRVV